MKKREWVAGKPKKKPDYDSGQITEEVLSAVVAAYRPVEGKHPSLQTMKNCGKKILINTVLFILIWYIEI